ncbi:MAG: pyridoxamine 5'-phosphate oxidase family protein [Rhodospirillaceae bacterium]|nr:pyridoxamine 5'-phosphate oxidase family protein [Rhodospirillaceae bacterium]
MPDGHQPDPYAITDRAALRAVYKTPFEGAVKKVLPALENHGMAFIAASPFCVLATSDENGNLDASPKGGPPGFVKVHDAKTVMIPDWPGNNRLDGLENIITNPHVGVLFFVPGMNEMLRLNGRAVITTDPALKPAFETKGKLPISVIVITIDQVYLHCARALDRSALWDATRQVDRKQFPTIGQMLADQIVGYDGVATDAMVEKHKNDLY